MISALIQRAKKITLKTRRFELNIFSKNAKDVTSKTAFFQISSDPFDALRKKIGIQMKFEIYSSSSSSRTMSLNSYISNRCFRHEFWTLHEMPVTMSKRTIRYYDPNLRVRYHLIWWTRSEGNWKTLCFRSGLAALGTFCHVIHLEMGIFFYILILQL